MELKRLAAFCLGRNAKRLNPPLFEIASVLVRFDQVAGLIVNANHSVM
jgi:hypothetical protein